MTTLASVVRGTPPDPELGAEGAEAIAFKAGAVLSSANKKDIMEALDRLRAVLKKAGMDDAEANKAVAAWGQKCGIEAGAVYIDDWQPYGGAQSFAEFDSWDVAQDQQAAISNLTAAFQTLNMNIWNDDDLTLDQKASATKNLAAELEQRIQRVPTMTDDQLDLDVGGMGIIGAASRRGVLGRMARSLGLGGKAQTKTEGGDDYSASAYADVPDPEKPSTWKLRLEESPGKVTVAQVARAITALGPSGFRGNKVEIGSSKAEVVKKISAAIGKTGGDDDQKKNLEERLAKVKMLGGEVASAEAGSISIFFDTKSASWRYVAVATNRYYDREGEVFPAAAHKEYVDWANRTKTYPELRLWHVPGSRIGAADGMAYDEEHGFRVSTGTFDAGMEDVAERLAGMKGNLMSHGYIYREDEFVGGQYKRYRDFEESVLPADAAANLGTAFVPVLEGDKMLKDEQRDYMLKALGPDRVKALEGSMASWAKEFTDAGVGFKGLDIDLADAPAAGAAAGDGAGAAATAAAAAKTGTDAGAGDGAGAATAVAPAPVDDPQAAGIKAIMLEALTPIAIGIRELGERVEKLEKPAAAVDLAGGAGDGAAAAGDGTAAAEGEKSLSEQLAEMISPRGWRDPAALAGASRDDGTIIKGKGTKAGEGIASVVAAITAASKERGEDGEGPDDGTRNAAQLAGMVLGMARSPALINAGN